MKQEKEQRMQQEINDLKKALAECIFNRSFVNVKCIEYDPAGSTYSVEFTDKVKYWSKLCGLDLSKVDPSLYYK